MGGSPKKFFRPFGPHFGLEVRGGASLRKHPFLFVLRRETSTAAKSEEKRMFSKARGVGGGGAARRAPPLDPPQEKQPSNLTHASSLKRCSPASAFYGLVKLVSFFSSRELRSSLPISRSHEFLSERNELC